MRFLRVRWFVLPVVLGGVISLSPDSSLGQPGRDRGGDRGGRDSRGGPGGGAPAPGGFGQSAPGGFGQGAPPGSGAPGGGFSFGRGGGFTSDSSFDRLLASYGGSGDVLDYSRVSQESRDRTNRFAQMTGAEPMPISGTITRDQYREVFAQRMARMTGGGGASPFGGTPGTSTASITPMGAQPSPFQGGGFPPGGQPPSSGGFSFGRSSDPMSYLRERDKNQDGKLDMNEASDRLRGVFQQYDANKDGFVDATEVTTYMTDRQNGTGPASGSSSPMGGFQPPMGGFQPPPSGDNRDSRRDSSTTTDDLPTVYRYGHLPKEVPSWFADLDGDKDGQVGLYEWRNAGRVSKDFVEMDLNGDCYLTATEWIRYNTLAIEKRAKADSESAKTGEERRGGGGFSFGGSRGGPPSSGGNDRGGPPSSSRDPRAGSSGGGDPRGGSERRNPFTGR